MKKTTIALMAAASFALINCEKHEAECFLPEPAFTVNGEAASDETITLNLVDNESLILSASEFEGYTFQWAGPNGYTSNLATAEIPDATSAASGEYTLTATKGICTASRTISVVVDALSLPCTPQNNKLTFSGSTSLTPINFYGVNAGEFGGVFEITANGSNGDLTISFATEAAPETGIYTISTDCPTSFLDGNEVCMSMVYANQYCVADSGQIVITKLDNGKYIAQFCDVLFNSPLPFTLVASAKITEQ